MKRALRFVPAFSLVTALGFFCIADARSDSMTMGNMKMAPNQRDSSSATHAQAKTAARHSKRKLVPQKTCPVMGNPIDTSMYTDYKGKRVYFCCAMCPQTFLKDPQKYLNILAEKGEEPIAIPKK